MDDGLRAGFASCSDKLAKLSEASKSKCPKNAGKGEDSSDADTCKQLETMVRLHAYVCATLKSVVNVCFMLVVVYDSVLCMSRSLSFVTRSLSLTSLSTVDIAGGTAKGRRGRSD